MTAPAGAPIDVLEMGDNRMLLSIGPQHPSTHGVLQVITQMEG
jgi:NADH:ubiquinone oxidoreductase subunit D